VRWLLAEWPAGQPEPVKYWLSSLPDDQGPGVLSACLIGEETPDSMKSG
jgi:hypothetical protein